MKLLVVGSRSIREFDISAYIPKGISLVISGGANGIDSIAEAYADKHRISKLILRPRYDLYGRAAPIKRNEEMVGIADEIIVFWDGISKGARSTIDLAAKHNTPCRIVLVSPKQDEV